jgi:hypothetical protein
MNFRLYQHTNTNNILVHEQFGFLTKSSTGKATFICVSERLDTLNNKKTFGSIFWDLEKDFDCVNDILLSTLEFYGVRHTVDDLIKYYLKNRHQTVLKDSQESYECPL